MPRIELPFPFNKPQHILPCKICHLLPPDLQKQAGDYKHLGEYLHTVPYDGVGAPRYLSELSRKLLGTRMPHFVYPLREEEGGERTFIHIYPDSKDVRDYYIPVEPIIGLDLEDLVAEIELKLLESWGKLSAAAGGEQRKQELLKLIDEICHVRDKSGSWLKGSKNSIIRLTPRQLAGVKYRVLRDKTGMGILDPLLQDPYIEDISCSGIEDLSIGGEASRDGGGRQQIFIEHRIFGSLKTPIVFTDYQELDDFVLRLADKVKAPATARRPIVDSVLPDGSRINIVYGTTISKRGSNFTIRKFSEIPLSILELIELGTIDYNMAAYLFLVVGEGSNVFVSGETASGKTTLLNAITTFIRPEAKIVSIEDTPELRVPHKNWVREMTKVSPTGERGAEVSMFELLRAALRQRPNFIIVGEIRGEEGNIAFQAMQTGHAVMATFHAGSVQKLLQRLTGSPINIPKSYIDNLNLVIILSQVRLPNGKMGRRVLSINEIMGYNATSNSFSFVEVFYWDVLRDNFVFAAHTTSYLLEEKIALRLGIPPERKQQVYEELRRRAKLLQRLHRGEGVHNFYQLFQALGKLRKEGEF